MKASNNSTEDLNAAFGEAVALHKAGKIQQAAEKYEGLLPSLHAHPELLYLLGAAYVHLNRPKDAVPVLESSLTARPGYVPAIEMAGSAWTLLNNPHKALEYFNQAAQIQPSSIPAHCRLGSTLATCGLMDEAAEAFQRVLALDPAHPEALTGLAFTLHKLGRSPDAESYARKCIAEHPAHLQAHTVLADILSDTGRQTEAESFLRQSLASGINAPALQYGLAITLHKQGKLAEAEQMYRAAIAAGVGGANIQVQLGDVLSDLGKLDDAEASFKAARLSAPEEPGPLTGLGRVAELRGDLQQALAFHERAIQRDQKNAHALINRGNAKKYLGDFEGALADFRLASSIDPSLHAAQASEGMLLLSLGRFKEGWPAFKARIKARPGSIDLGGGTLREIGAMDGKDILVWTEYGLGDEILFASLLPEIMQRAASSTLVCSPRLVTLFRRTFPKANVLPLGAELGGPFDMKFALTDAAEMLRPDFGSFPAHQGYVRVDETLSRKLRQKYKKDSDAPLVGISWHSGGSIGTGPFKSIPLKNWLPIIQTSGLNFVSLQYGSASADVAPMNALDGVNILLDTDIDPSGDLDAFAAQVNAMDLVISVSNTTVHVAGALGKPVWALVPKGLGAHWYWFQEMNDSPWYPSLKLFRQDERGAWERPLKDVLAHLTDWRQT